MKTEYTPIRTKVGIISGRDAIYLDSYNYDIKQQSLTLRGELSGSLLEKKQDGFVPYNLVFFGVTEHQITDLETFGYSKGRSSFDEITTSPPPEQRYFLVRTYDDVFEITASSFDLRINTK